MLDPRLILNFCIFFFQAEDGIRDGHVTGVQTCALPIYPEAAVKMFEKAYPKAESYAYALDQWKATIPLFTSNGGYFHQTRSEERRVGKECRARRWRCQ